MVACPHLSAGLLFDVGELPPSSVPPCFPWCLWPPCYFFFSWIATGNENGSPYYGFDSLDLCETIISRFNCYPRSPLAKSLFSVNIESLVICMNYHKKNVLHANPSPRARNTVTGCAFTTKFFFKVITIVTCIPLFPCLLSFLLSTQPILNVSMFSISFI